MYIKHRQGSTTVYPRFITITCLDNKSSHKYPKPIDSICSNNNSLPNNQVVIDAYKCMSA